MKAIFTLILLINSLCYSQGYDNRVYHVVRFVSTDDGYMRTEPGGTAFFISKTHFVSAYHVFRNFPLDSGKFHCQLFLLNSDNDLIVKYKLKVVKPEYDFVLGEIDENEGHDPYVWEYTDEYSKNDSVYNIGFPLDSMNRNFIFLTALNNGIRDSLPVYSKSGVLLKDSVFTFEKDGLGLKNRKIIKYNYLTSKGDSGGPLVLKSNNKVIGIVSFSIDGTNREYSQILKRFIGNMDNYSGAIRFKDVMKYLE